MSDFSIGDTVGSGFGLISRRPLSVLAWAVVYLVLVVVPARLHFAAIHPVWTAMMHALIARLQAGGRPDFSELQPYGVQMAHAGGLMWLSLLGGLLASAVLSAAVYRSVIEPENRSFASLRLGAQELWLALLFILLPILLAITYFVIAALAVILIILAAVVGHSTSQTVGGLVIVAISIGTIAAFLWVCVRFSLAGPLTFKARRLQLFESWTMTGGHAWKLFGLALLITLIVIALSVVIMAIEGAVFLSMAGVNGFDLGRVRDMVAGGGLWRPVSTWFVIAAAVRAVVGAAFLAIMVAPWATACRELGESHRDDRWQEHPAVY